jgi:hypothetical protein
MGIDPSPVELDLDTAELDAAMRRGGAWTTELISRGLARAWSWGLGAE